jgi:hypothetical protein
MQFNDRPAAQRVDAEKIFSLGSDVITGTEAGRESLKEILRDAAKTHGYAIFLSEPGEWIAVRDGLGKVRRSGLVPVLPGQRGPARLGGHAPRGIFWTEVLIPEVGVATFATGHFLTKGRSPRTRRGRQNIAYQKALADFTRSRGRGSRLVFFSADTNLNDRKIDVFGGGPLVSAWDEVGTHPSTHGPRGGTIDVIARHTGDGRVRFTHAEALNALGLSTDHYTIRAVAEIRPLSHP